MKMADKDVCDILHLVFHVESKTVELIIRQRIGRVISATCIGGPYAVGDWDQIMQSFRKHYYHEAIKRGAEFREEVDFMN